MTSHCPPLRQLCSEQCKADMPTGTQTETPEKSISISPPHSPQTSPVASPVAPQFSPVAPHTSAVALQNSPIAPHFSLVAPQLSPADISENNSQSQSEMTQQCVILIPRPLYGVKLIGDNIDWTIHPCFIRFDHQTQSVHFFNCYALKDRIDLSDLSDVPPPMNQPSMSDVISKIFPNEQEEILIHDEFAILLARMLCSHIPYFKKTFADVIDWHIKHRYSSEMSTKSEVVSGCNSSSTTLSMIYIYVQTPLGLQMKNENKYSEMIDIMTCLHQYVPVGEATVTTGSAANVVNKPKDHPLLFGGDQLTAA